jgi:Ca2+ transporting ATPase
LIDVLDAFIIGLTVVVVAVPEGLPLAVTISLAFSVGAMAKEHNLVKKLHASETMGNAQEICTDKTGTLTQNRMTVMEAYLEDSIVASQRNPALKGSAIAELVGEGIVFNSTATIEQKDDGSKETIGNVTECGLLNYLVDAGFDVEEKLKERRNDIDFLFSIPFSSKRKRATTVFKHPSQEGKVRVYCKGAPEIVIKYCDYLLGAGGESESLSEEKKNQIVGETVKGFATKTYRTLLISYCDYDEAEWEQLKGQANDFQSLTDKENVESGLTVIGIFALVDPLRPGIPQSVR